jgi:hypothetical protein
MKLDVFSFFLRFEFSEKIWELLLALELGRIEGFKDEKRRPECLQSLIGKSFIITSRSLKMNSKSLSMNEKRNCLEIIFSALRLYPEVKEHEH